LSPDSCLRQTKTLFEGFGAASMRGLMRDPTSSADGRGGAC
jgi:hypothetical protein